jgi:hypothetical protein
MDGRCGSCRFWTPSEYVRGDGFCERTRVDASMRRVLDLTPNLAEAYAPLPSIPGDLNERGYPAIRGTPAVLICNEAFGCVQFQPKED